MGGSDLLTGSIPSKAFVVAASHNEILRRGACPRRQRRAAPGQFRQDPRACRRGRGVAGAKSFGRTAHRARASTSSPPPPASPTAGRSSPATSPSAPAALSSPRGPCRLPPDLPGLDGVDYMTADQAFDVVRKPSHLLILGADARALELAQAYTRLGIDATVIDDGQGARRRRSGTGARSSSTGCAPKGVRVRDGVTIAGMARRKRRHPRHACRSRARRFRSTGRTSSS